MLVAGGNDWLADPKDELWLLERIKDTVVKFIYIDRYNHIDFLWGMDAPATLYYPLIELMKSML